MQSINITDLRNYNAKLILEYLNIQQGLSFEIIIPKESVDPDDRNFSIFWQYYCASYAGQLLFNKANSFAYYVPCPQKQNDFRFQIEVESRDSLSHALAFIIAGYFTDGSTMLRFNEQASKYFDDSFTGKTDSACWGLLYIANQFLCK